MPVSVRVLNVENVIKGLELKEINIEMAADVGVMRVAQAIEGEAKRQFTGGKHTQSQTKSGRVKWTPSGHIGVNGEGPNKRSGYLWASIRANRVSGLNGYAAEVSVGAVYARAVEEGSPRWRSGVKYPYMKPAIDKVTPIADRIFTVAILKALR